MNFIALFVLAVLILCIVIVRRANNPSTAYAGIVGVIMTFIGLIVLIFFMVGCAAVLHAPAKQDTRPLSAIAVSQCGQAVALFIQLDKDHLFRADPRQSDLFVNVDGQMVQQHAPPMKWEDAFSLAQKATLSSHVLIPCTDGPQI